MTIQTDRNSSIAEAASTIHNAIPSTRELWLMGGDQRARGRARVLGDEIGG